MEAIDEQILAISVRPKPQRQRRPPKAKKAKKAATKRQKRTKPSKSGPARKRKRIKEKCRSKGVLRSSC